VGQREIHIGLWYENLKEMGYLEDPGVHGKIILKRIFKIGRKCVDWIHLAKDTDVSGCCEQGYELTSSTKREISWLADGILACRGL
jgi:hypothetical protein